MWPYGRTPPKGTQQLTIYEDNKKCICRPMEEHVQGSPLFPTVNILADLFLLFDILPPTPHSTPPPW